VKLENYDPNESSEPQPRLGSLTQAARSKQLRSARGYLFFVGGWLILMLILEWVTLDMQLKAVAEKEGIPPARIPEMKELVMPVLYVFSAILVALSLLYIVFGIIVHKYPVPITITALVIFVALWLIYAVIDPANLYRGIILKIIVIVGLAKAIQAAIAYKREQELAEDWPVVVEEETEPRRQERTEW
jgi:hypothetical protein